MSKFRDTLQIAFFGIWILVGLLALFSLSKYLSSTLPDPTQGAAALGTQQPTQGQQQQTGQGQQIPVQPDQQMQQQMPGQSLQQGSNEQQTAQPQSSQDQQQAPAQEGPTQ